MFSELDWVAIQVGNWNVIVPHRSRLIPVPIDKCLALVPRFTTTQEASL